jgi:hypothetical protein
MNRPLYHPCPRLRRSGSNVYCLHNAIIRFSPTLSTKFLVHVLRTIPPNRYFSNLAVFFVSIFFLLQAANVYSKHGAGRIPFLISSQNIGVCILAS